VTSPFYDLGMLATYLRGVVGSGQPVVLDDKIVAPATAGALAAAFALPDGQHLTVTGIVAGDVGAPVGGVLSVGTGRGSVLTLIGVPLGLTFWLETGALQVCVAAAMPGGWAFVDSFPGLTLFPFDRVAVSGALFVYTSVEQKAFGWPGEAGTTVDLRPGQNLLCRLGLGSVSLLGYLLGDKVAGKDTTIRFSGGFAPTTGQVLPVGTLTAPVDLATFSVGTPPNALSVTDPRIDIRIGTANPGANPAQEIDLSVLGTFQDALEVSVSIPMAGDLFRISATPQPGKGSVAGLIESLPGGSDFRQYIPAEVDSVFDTVGLDSFIMVANTTPAVTYLGLSIGTQQPWPAIANVIELENLKLVIEVVNGDDSSTSVRFDADATFLREIFPSPFDFSVGLVEQDSSWAVDIIAGRYDATVNLGDLVADLLGNDSSVPLALHEISLSDFGVAAKRYGPGQPFEYTGFASAEATLPMLDTELVASLTVVFDKTSVQLLGALTVGEEKFRLDLDLGTSGSLHAGWISTGNPLGLDDIAHTFGWTGIPTLPGNLDLGLSKVDLSYDFATKSLVLAADSTNYGQLVFASSVVNTKRVYVVDLTVPLNVQLSDIPVVGSQIPPSLDVGLQQLEIACASADYPADAVSAVNTALSALGAQPLSYPSLAAGMVFIANLQLGNEVQPLTVPLGSSGGQQQQLTAGPPTPADPSPAPTQASGKWFDIGRNFGPLQIQRVGIEYSDGTLIFALDANVAFGSVALSLDGLGVGSKLSAFFPVFSLSGLGVSYTSPPMEVLGAILRVPDSQLSPDVKFQFDGTLVVKAEDFSLAALGSYAQLTSGLPSLFVFAQLEAPLGGPPPFFVTGLMGGFGFNRSLAIPGQDEVASFPLLVLATSQPGTSQDPAKVLEVLEGRQPQNGVAKAWITPKAGDYWLAAGVEFTSFKLVNTKALLVAEFGQELTIALLGLSTLQLPLPETQSPPYAYVEMMIRVVVQPSQGSFAATAILSPSSYVIAPDGHLTGGFAFSLWFGENANAGQFVATLGGYHPAFRIPSYFPQVPRLGFNWAVSDVVSVKGTAYFALTGSCAMAGGGLEVSFHDGDLQASFTAQADFLVSWHPFFYTAQIAVSISVSYRLSLGFCHKTINASISAELNLWGPPTGGVARVNLQVVSFSVPFGSAGAGTATQPLPWNDFVKLLPSPTVCGIAITDGLFKTQDAATESNSSGKRWIVRAGRVAFQTRSAVPASEVSYAGTVVHQSLTRAGTGGIAIKPMNLTAVVSTHTLAIYQDDSTTPIDASGWSLAPLRQTVPASLWSAPPVPFTQVPVQPSADVLPGELCGFEVTAPLPQPGDTRGPVSVSVLMEEYLSPAGQAPLSGAVTPSPDYRPTVNQQTIGLLGQVDTGSAQHGRAALFGVLAGVTLPDRSALFAGANDDLAVLAAGAGHLFSDSPMQQT
jgi:hypothetical protein